MATGLKSLREDGVRLTLFRSVSYTMDSLFDGLRNRLYTWSGRYGLKDALLWPTHIWTWTRYSTVLLNLPKAQTKQPLSILEIGSGGLGIARFLGYTKEKNDYKVTLSDVSFDSLLGVRLGRSLRLVVADGCRLPFRDESFDVVVCVDMVEHIPKQGRPALFEELKRVAGCEVMLHFPMDSGDGQWVGRALDLRFQEKYTKHFGREEPNTAEHISAGHPTLEEVKEAFPDAQIQGVQNADIWLKCILFNTTRLFLRYLTGLLYFMRLKGKDDTPPWHGCFLIYDKY